MDDVEYVDEDGNLIEGGKEQLLYVDKKGRVVSEKSAKKLLDSGRYIDSRVLYNGVRNVNKTKKNSNSLEKKKSFNELAKEQSMQLIKNMEEAFAKARTQKHSSNSKTDFNVCII
jgi:hypothetical protein